MEFGLQSRDMEIIRTILGSFPHVEQAIIYGSRAKGNYKPASDIDLTLAGKHLDLTEQLAITSALDDSSLPYTFDISIFHHISNPDLLDHIERVGKIFYERSQD